MKRNWQVCFAILGEKYLDNLVLILQFLEEIFQFYVVVNGAADIGCQKRKEETIGDEGLLENIIQKSIVALDDFFKVFYFLEIFIQLMKILLYNFFAEVVTQSFYEGENSVVQFICIFEAFHRSNFLQGLEHEPALAELPFQKFAPKHKSEESLILRQTFLVENQIQRKFALEIKGYVVDVF